LKSEYSHYRWLHHYQVFSSHSTLNIYTSTIHKFKITRVFGRFRAVRKTYG